MFFLQSCYKAKMSDDPTKAPEFNRVIDHFLNKRVQPKAKQKERPASKGRVRKVKSRT
jgi:hypothetical protein